MHRDDLALDFGLIHLSGNICEQLATNGVLCVSQSKWHKPPGREFFHHIALGFPLRSTNDPRKRGFMQPVAVGIDRVDADEVPQHVADGWFVGRLRPAADIETVRGMSGGPVFGFWKDDDDQTHFSVFALQSWWDRRQRIVYACPITSFAETLHHLVDAPTTL